MKKLFVITSPDTVGVSLVDAIDKAGYSVVHPMFDWKSERGKETATRLELPQGKLPLEYEAIRLSNAVVADLEADPTLLAEFMSMAILLELPIIGVFQVSPQPSKFLSWCEAIVPHQRLIASLDKRLGGDNEGVC